MSPAEPPPKRPTKTAAASEAAEPHGQPAPGSALLNARGDLAIGLHTAQIHLAHAHYNQYASYIDAVSKAANDAAKSYRDAYSAYVDACSHLPEDKGQAAQQFQEAQQQCLQAIRDAQDAVARAEQGARERYIQAVQEAQLGHHRDLRNLAETYAKAVSGAYDPRGLAGGDPHAFTAIAAGLISAAHALATVPPVSER
jgi:hypothetical protein